MDEYFCPNCGAILNDQYGFDPSYGTWTCTACGQGLMDDDIYNGDTFEGVAWYCDGCGVLLNRQSGFSDSQGSWVCAECGYLNSITEEDIIEDPYYCPNCRTILNTQWGFNKYDAEHECSSCGSKLHHGSYDERYSVIVEDNSPKCPNCGAKLKEQFCFAEYQNDWNCTECGAHLHHDFSSDPFEVVEEDGSPKCPNCGASLNDQYGFAEYEDDWMCTECSAHLHRDYSSDPYEVIEAEEDTSDESSGSSYVPPSFTTDLGEGSNKKEKKLPDSELKKKRRRAFLFKGKKVQIGFSCTDLLRKNVEEVEIRLHNQAFNNIKAIPIKDIYKNSTYTAGEVEQVIIAGSSYFTEGDMIPYDAEIIITYHAKKEITIPFAEKSLKKMHYIAAGDKLQELGFTEIYERPIRDLVTGWIKKDGSVEKVTIGDVYPFRKNSVFAYDVKITIEHHTFKKK